MIRKWHALLGALVLILITAVATLTISEFRAFQVGERVIMPRSMYERMQQDTGGLEKVEYLKEFLLEEYYEELDPDLLIDGALRGMFEAVDDPYTTYLDKDEYSELMISTEGTYGGIGLIVTADEEGYVSVVSPIEGTPGEEAGLATGDRILQVDGKSVSGNRLDDAVNLMRGEPDTEVALEVQKRNQTGSKDIVITRETIRIESVRSKMLEGGVGYLRLITFDQQTTEDFRSHLKELEEKGANSLILDLRNNPGGLMGQAVQMADLFLGEGLIVYTEDREGKRREQHSSAQEIGMEMVVLINEGSASASEILAGAIQDHDRGTVVGTRSFGKGLVQELQQMPDGSGFKYTVSQYYTPLGRSIHEQGIEPDLSVELPEDEMDEHFEFGDETDRQLQKAIEVIREKQSNTRANEGD